MQCKLGPSNCARCRVQVAGRQTACSTAMATDDDKRASLLEIKIIMSHIQPERLISGRACSSVKSSSSEDNRIAGDDAGVQCTRVGMGVSLYRTSTLLCVAAACLHLVLHITRCLDEPSACTPHSDACAFS